MSRCFNRAFNRERVSFRILRNQRRSWRKWKGVRALGCSFGTHVEKWAIVCAKRRHTRRGYLCARQTRRGRRGLKTENARDDGESETDREARVERVSAVQPRRPELEWLIGIIWIYVIREIRRGGDGHVLSALHHFVIVQQHPDPHWGSWYHIISLIPPREYMQT